MAEGQWLMAAMTRCHQPSAISHDECCSHHPPPADQSHQEQYDGDDQQYVDEVPHRVAADQAEQPQNDQNDSDRFQHLTPPVLNPEFRRTWTATRMPEDDSWLRLGARPFSHQTPSGLG